MYNRCRFEQNKLDYSELSKSPNQDLKGEKPNKNNIKTSLRRVSREHFEPF